MGDKFQKISVLHDVSVDSAKSNAVQIPTWADFIGVKIPNLGSNANITMEILDADDATASTLLASGDTGWSQVLDPSTGTQAVICTNAPSDPAWVDLSTFLRAFKNQFLRFVMSATQAADSTFIIYFGD